MAADLLLHRALALERPAVFAAVGGGGKTTLLSVLAAEADADAGLTVLTTTTKMTLPPEGDGLPLILGRSEASRAGALEDVHRRGLNTAVVGAGRGERGRILGVAAAWPQAGLRLPGVGLVAVEADGAAGRPFKAPAEHEPVLPHGVNVVAAVVGVQVLGQPLSADHVHRPERAAALTGAAPGSVITADLVAAVLAHPDGGRKAVPAAAAFVVVVTGAGRHERGAQAIAAACHLAGIERVVAFDQRQGVLRNL